MTTLLCLTMDAFSFPVALQLTEKHGINVINNSEAHRSAVGVRRAPGFMGPLKKQSIANTSMCGKFAAVLGSVVYHLFLPLQFSRRGDTKAGA